MVQVVTNTDNQHIMPLDGGTWVVGYVDVVDSGHKS